MSTSFSHNKNGGFVPFCSGSAEVLPDPNLCPKFGRGCVGNFYFFRCALLENGGVSIFSDLECPSGVRHRNSADSAEIGGLGFLLLSETGFM